MKVMLIIPAYSRKIYSDKERETNWDYHSLGLAYIATVAESLGHEVKILDCEVYQFSTNDAKSHIKKFMPDVIGMQVFYFTSGSCYKISKLAKEVNPSIKVILGGLHPTISPDESISQDGVDFVIREEGEVVFKNLLQALNNGCDFSKVNGLIWKHEGNVIKNKPEKQIENIDNIAYPALHLFPMELYHSSAMMQGNKTLHIVSSRGCHAKCSFCIVPHCFGATYRSQSAARVVDELKFWIKKYDIDSFQFLDDSFTYEKKRVIEICNLLIKEKITMPWTCFSRVNDVDGELLMRMKEAGCYQIIYGVETLAPRLLEMLNKNITQDDVFNAFNDTHKAGIEGMASLMTGMPTETVEDTLSTINFLIKTEADLLIYHRFNPWKGVPLYDFAMKNGTVICHERDRYLLKWTDVVYVPHGRTAEKIIATEKKCLRKFYFRPRQLVKTLNNLKKLPVRKSIKLIQKGLDDFF